MADNASSLPIRTEAAGDVAVKLVDATTPAQGLGNKEYSMIAGYLA